MSRPTHAIPALVDDWRALDLSDGGRSLVEASAGTGKTWTISVLYLRLLLERELTPRQIVVTTFTNAAADELRERLRGRLLWAETRAAAGPGRSPEPGRVDEGWLHARWHDNDARRARDLLRLRVALAELDMAPVVTLHGLCQRILGEHPFAAGVPFDGGELVSADGLVDTLATDVLRRVQQGAADDGLARLYRLAGLRLDRKALAAGIRLLLQPGSRMQDAIGPEGGALQVMLPREWAERLRCLTARDELFNKNCVLRRAWDALADFIDAPDGAAPDGGTVERLGKARALTNISKLGKADPEVLAAAEFSESVAPMLAGLDDDRRRRFWQAVADWARVQTAQRLALLGQRTFDALMTTVGRALAAEDGQAERPLADALYRAWPVALVDEFQDTDAVQYGILDNIYRAADGAQRGRLVMIGDPKQAIYRFRGGDIHAYAQAAATAGQRMTLDTNRRSARRFVDALNSLYAVAGRALAAGDESQAILCEPVRASDRQDASPYRIDGVAVDSPLVIHYHPQAPRAAPARVAQALEACADQIAGMLGTGTHTIGARALEAGDLAVLLPRNAQVEALRRELQRRGVPCVATTRSSVFAGDTARELLLVLHAVAHCDDLGPIRAAVATRLWGRDYADIRALGDDPAGWRDTVELFQQWRHDWLGRGVLAVVDALVARVAASQLDRPAGERVLTDLRHLGELLQAQAGHEPGTEELLAWFSAQREQDGDGGDAADARQLRIESDARRVRLMTLHASKGLEFPVVFLPLMWAHGEMTGGTLYAVESGQGAGRVLDVTRQAREQERAELQDERFRLLYVALTRAVHACHVYALDPGRPASARTASPASGTARSALDVMLARMEPAPGSPELVQATPAIAWCEGLPAADQAPRLDADDADAPERQARPLPAEIDGPLPGRHSFTTLTRGLWGPVLDPGAAAGDELDAGLLPEPLPEGAADALDTVAVPAPDPAIALLSPVRGADFGNAVHAIFENRAVGQPLSEQHGLIRRQLDAFGVRHPDIAPEQLVERLAARLQAVLDAPLDASGSLRLGALGAGDQRAEMEFFFALDGASMRRLRAACAAHGEPALVPPGDRVLAGLMNGKIDLAFRHGGRVHVLDYKGNHLGDTVADYAGDQLRARMDQSHYRFQALLYTVAVERYLRQRLGGVYRRDAHLGDVWYLFIRAVGLQPGAGVWHARFGDGLLDAVQAELATRHGLEEGA